MLIAPREKLDCNFKPNVSESSFNDTEFTLTVLRNLGKNMGLWKRGGQYFYQWKNQLFCNLEFSGKSMLDMGCGLGLNCIWASIHGAKPVIGLEPLEAGSGAVKKAFKVFTEIVNTLQLKDIEILPYKFQDYNIGPNYFDIVLMTASINHLDEESCIHLRDSSEAYSAYVSMFKKLRSIMKTGGKLIVTDCSNRNFFGDLGIKNPFEPNIEWRKHQQPKYWAKLLYECGFSNPQISWLSKPLLRHLGMPLRNALLSYFIDSVFRLEMTAA